MLAMLHLSVAPAHAQIQVVRAARWDAATARGLTLLETKPDQRQRLLVITWDGRRLECLGGHLVPLDESAYQARLSAWRARDPGRRALPALGEALVIENRFQRGRPLAGCFAGFDGPFLLLETSARPRTLMPLALDNLRLASAAGRLTLAARALDRAADWPPSRGSLAFREKGDAMESAHSLPLDSLRGLKVMDDGTSNLIFLLLPAVLMGLLLFGNDGVDWNLWGEGNT